MLVATELPQIMNYWNWTWLGIGLVVLVIAWWAFATVFAARRAKPLPNAPEVPKAVAPLALTGDPYEPLRAFFLRRIDGIEKRWEAGELDNRTVHLELAGQLRNFASQRVGVDASTLTLAEIRGTGAVRRLLPMIRKFHEPSFARESTADPRESLEQARRVVGEW
mgnify:CR=1 FL=1